MILPILMTSPSPIFYNQCQIPQNPTTNPKTGFFSIIPIKGLKGWLSAALSLRTWKLGSYERGPRSPTAERTQVAASPGLLGVGHSTLKHSWRRTVVLADCERKFCGIRISKTTTGIGWQCQLAFFFFFTILLFLLTLLYEGTGIKGTYTPL